ncbi:MAG: LytR C-terminal domain-containing protein, partial [Solirubrobacteraceae bacterium]
PLSRASTSRTARAAATERGREPAGRPSRPTRSSSPGRGTALRLGAVLVGVLLVVLVATQLFGGGGSSGSKANTVIATGGAGTGGATTGAALPQSSVTVAVLNGTRTAGLAGKVADTLVKGGYHRGAVGNAPTQAHTTTLVGYARGGKAAAQGVARAINIDPAAVTALDPATAARAPGAQVVVTVGSDRQQQ